MNRHKRVSLDDNSIASRDFKNKGRTTHGLPGMRRRVCLYLSCRDQKAVKFQVKIDRSTLEKTHYKNFTLNSKKNLALANAALGRY